MYSKSDLISALNHEFNVLKHLYSKVQEQHLVHKFTEKQRTIKELLQYLANSPLLTTQLIVNGGQSSMTGEEYKALMDGTDASNFPALIDQESKEITALIEGLSDEQLQEEVTLWGVMKGRRAQHLVGVLTQVVAYKMQLFLQMKHAGLHDLGTSNLWGGYDTPTQA